MEASWRDVLACIALFLGFPGTLMILWGIRAFREGRRKAQTEAETEAAEGYPPPDPPTTDSLSD